MSKANRFSATVADNEFRIRLRHAVLKAKRDGVRHAVEARHGQAVNASRDLQAVVEEHEVQGAGAEGPLPSGVVVVQLRMHRVLITVFGWKGAGTVAGGVGSEHAQASHMHIHTGKQR